MNPREEEKLFRWFCENDDENLNGCGLCTLWIVGNLEIENNNDIIETENEDGIDVEEEITNFNFNITENDIKTCHHWVILMQMWWLF